MGGVLCPPTIVRDKGRKRIKETSGVVMKVLSEDEGDDEYHYCRL